MSNPKSIYTKTSKGMMEVAGKTNAGLPRDIKNVLSLVDGKLNVAQLQERCGLPMPKVLEALTALTRNGFVREFVVEDTSFPESNLDFTFIEQRPSAPPPKPAAPPTAAEEKKR
ncbi:MAG: hypothetical protein ACOY4U_00795, partial [Pseudomonadota bacterium]